jgi:hypothetical protein
MKFQQRNNVAIIFRLFAEQQNRLEKILNNCSIILGSAAGRDRFGIHLLFIFD